MDWRTFFLFAAVASAAAQSAPSTVCRQIVVTGQLASGEALEKRIGGGLVFRIAPEKPDRDGKANGWEITLGPSGTDDDYIYPVTPPLRFNGVQTLGPSYGDDAKASLGHTHEMRFVLDSADYKRIWPLLTNALWPYSAPDPDKAGFEYLAALRHLSTGLLRLSVTSYDKDADTELIRRIEFRAEFSAPASFHFEPNLKPQQAECPSPAE